MTQWWARDKETEGNTIFLRKKYAIKGKMDSLWTPRNITPIDGWCYEETDSSFSQEVFLYLKILSMQFRKKLELKISKKEWAYLSKEICIPMLYVTRMTQNKNDSINKLDIEVWSCRQQKLLCSVSCFRISIFVTVSQTVQKEDSYHLLSCKD